MRLEDSLCKMHLSILYERQGGYSKIVEIINRSGLISDSKDKYFAHNIFHSLRMQGLIDVVWEETGIKWYINKSLLDGGVVENYAFGEDLLKIDNCNAKVFSKTDPIGFCKNNSDQKDAINLKHFSSIGEITDFILTDKSLVSLSIGEIDIYSFVEDKWEQNDIEYNESILIRQKDRFSGYRYYIYILDHKNAFKVNDPEWLFIVSAYMLNLDFRKILVFDKGVLRVKSTFRLPALISMYLYQYSERVQLGYIHEYHNVNEKAVDELFTYLSPGRV